jgi:hypothetical protein
MRCRAAIHAGPSAALAQAGAWRTASAVLLGLSLGSVSDASAGEPPFGRFDVQTTFFISKSDNHNRVDYGIHLDEHCVPTRGDAVYFYWRDLEKAPGRVRTPGILDRLGYGISEQKALLRAPKEGVYMVKLRQLPVKPVQITTTQSSDGRCTTQARATINGKESELSYAFVKLNKGGLMPSVDYVDIHGKDLQTGQEVVERMRR